MFSPECRCPFSAECYGTNCSSGQRIFFRFYRLVQPSAAVQPILRTVSYNRYRFFFRWVFQVVDLMSLHFCRVFVVGFTDFFHRVLVVGFADFFRRVLRFKQPSFAIKCFQPSAELRTIWVLTECFSADCRFTEWFAAECCGHIAAHSMNNCHISNEWPLLRLREKWLIDES